MRKLTITARFLAALLVTLTFCHNADAQIETNSAPARWEYYTGRDKKVSFLLPRMPVYVPGGDPCRGEETEIYAVYHEGTVYRVDVTSKIDPRDYCLQKTRFDENSFKNRVKSLKSELRDETNSGGNILKDSVVKLTGEKRIVKLVNDFDNRRWVELSVYGGDEGRPEVKNFLESLKTGASSAGIEIGKGSAQTLGDEVSASEVQTLSNIIDNGKEQIEEIVTQITVKTKDATPSFFTIILKPRASYTDAARKRMEQGKVVLRVTFMANGAIGKISVVRGLGYGLTDQAVKAARRMVFVPQQKDGERVTVSKTVEYSFSIY